MCRLSDTTTANTAREGIEILRHVKPVSDITSDTMWPIICPPLCLHEVATPHNCGCTQHEGSHSSRKGASEGIKNTNLGISLPRSITAFDEEVLIDAQCNTLDVYAQHRHMQGPISMFPRLAASRLVSGVAVHMGTPSNIIQAMFRCG